MQQAGLQKTPSHFPNLEWERDRRFTSTLNPFQYTGEGGELRKKF